MHITLYHRSFPVAGAPEAVSLVPSSATQTHTFTVGGKVYKAVHKQLKVVVPEGAKLDTLKNLLCWSGAQGAVRSTAREVFDMAQAGTSGFGLA